MCVTEMERDVVDTILLSLIAASGAKLCVVGGFRLLVMKHVIDHRFYNW